ncbi:hypothetical protein BV22DRAFT_1021395 [Leucogyrophana mollusca]|uniref:Uncharacterized protein n=1 Tax=Leucogyrophana mollusca TaxID=85980 RepID=A0ACB8B654_9AGAM|nr:hypothetical protein BV22DRAFT_1021395 [Leucogyrophana mollusca]
MASWTQLDSNPRRRVFSRPLGVTETTFYWDGVLNSTADTVMHIQILATQGDDVALCSAANVNRAWSSVKQRFPLIAAEVVEQEDNSGSALQFILREENIDNLRAGDVTFGWVTSFEDAERFVTDILDGPRPLSSQLLARVYMLRRADCHDKFHVVIIVAHCVTDMCSTSTVIRSFFHTLASRHEHPTQALETRLDMYRSLEHGIPYGGLSLARQRWRRALGYAIHMARISGFKGGHTLPGRFTTSTSFTPALSRLMVCDFSRSESEIILGNCRRHNITFNTAYYALSQVAMTRIFSRRYLRGEMSEEEWEYRTRQPMHFNGPLNLRPYQDKEWFKKGGSGDVGLNISFFQYTLPSMPLGIMARRSNTTGLKLADGAPHFADLFPFRRFLHRCSIVKSTADKVFNHPRFVDIALAAHDRILPTRAAALRWLHEDKKVRSGLKSEKGAPIRAECMGPVLSLAGSTLGNMDGLIPADYPLPPSDRLSPLAPNDHPHRAGYYAELEPPREHQPESPRLRIEYWRTHLHARPAELYLGASTLHRQLQYMIFYDGRVFEEEIVREWLNEVKDATMWYLGQPHGEGGREQAKSRL